MRLIALDISLNCTGWSIVDVDDLTSKNMNLVSHGYIPNDREDVLEKRLEVIYTTLKRVCDRYNPDVWVGESQFFGSNAKTLMALSNCHGVCLLLASTYGKRIFYYSPMTIKSQLLQGVVLKDKDGRKKTSKQLKKEIENKVREYFKEEKFSDVTDDVFDAISVAMCYVNKEGKGWLGEVKKEKTPKKKKKKPTTT